MFPGLTILCSVPECLDVFGLLHSSLTFRLEQLNLWVQEGVRYMHLSVLPFYEQPCQILAILESFSFCSLHSSRCYVKWKNTVNRAHVCHFQYMLSNSILSCTEKKTFWEEDTQTWIDRKHFSPSPTCVALFLHFKASQFIKWSSTYCSHCRFNTASSFWSNRLS